MDKFVKIALLIITFLSFTKMSFGDQVPSPAPFDEIVAHSDVIFIGKLIKIERNPIWPAFSAKIGPQESPGGGIYLSVLGKYEFKMIYAIKGAPAEKLIVNLPAVGSMVYNYAEPTVATSSYYLLFMKKSHVIPGIDLVVTDSMLPFAVLGKKVEIPGVNNSNKKIPVLDQVCNVLLDTISDKILFQANTYLIEDIVNPKISEKLLPFIDDPNERIQSNVLACLATNQQVEAIPRIARLHAKILAEDGGGGCVEKLDGYKVKEAVPYLNPLLFSPCDSVRYGVCVALRKCGDSTSIPYLIAELADPIMINRYASYAALTRLLPKLGIRKDFPEFEKNPNGISLPYLNWWRDELLEKHIIRVVSPNH